MGNQARTADPAVAAEFEACIREGGVAVFPADTVYGLACNPRDRAAIQRLYALKGRLPEKPSAVMFFDLEDARAALPELPAATAQVLERLLPGPVTVLVADPASRFPLAATGDPQTLGLRVPVVPPLASVRVPVLQSSANLTGGADARRLEEVPEQIRSGADLVLDGGELPGTPSTVIDLRGYEHGGARAVAVLREGALSRERVAAALDAPRS